MASTDTGLDNASMQALINDQTKALLDVFDDLREHGVEDEIFLPQLVAAGDQSSGKSSVLKRLSNIPFESGEGLCTRFATQVVQRTAAEESAIVRIIPDRNRPSEEKRRLRQFQKHISDYGEFPGIVEQVNELFGFGEDAGNGPSKAFVKDILVVETHGPTKASMTIIDTPGIIHSQNRSASQADKALIHAMVEEHIQNPRTILLAVVSALNDVGNQAIFDKARAVDPDGRRVLAVVTKPDAAAKLPGKEAQWMELLQNEDIPLKLGWHVLKNKIDGDGEVTAEEIDEDEVDFFADDRFSGLAPDQMGLPALHRRIGTILHDHLVSSLPELEQEINTKLHTAVQDLRKLGDSRSSPRSQRIFLSAMSNTFQEITKAAIAGTYDNKYFTDASDVNDRNAVRKLRAEVVTLNLQFAKYLKQGGAKHCIANAATMNSPEHTDEVVHPGMIPTYADWATQQIPLSRNEAIQWVLTELQESRGCELPGSVNPALIRQLFGQQSSRWEGLAAQHVNQVIKKCHSFMYGLRNHAAGPGAKDVAQRVSELRIVPKLSKACNKALECLEELLEDDRRGPLTYNSLYAKLVQQARNKKTMSHVRTLVDGQNEAFGHRQEFRQGVDVNALENSMEISALQPDMDRFSAEDALDQLTACYQTVLTAFIEAVTKQVIERCLMAPLPDIVTPQWIAELTDVELNKLATEPSQIAQQRMQLEEQKRKLEYARQRFRSDLSHLYNA